MHYSFGKGSNILRILTITAFILALCGFAACTGTGSVWDGLLYTPGVYEGEGMGRQGPIQVRVSIDSNGITDIEILNDSEDPFTGRPAMEELSEAVLNENSTDVDAVSGATESSRCFLAAVEDALATASIIAGSERSEGP